MRFGVHVSIAGSIDKAVDRAEEKTCETFQIFTRNPRGWKFEPLTLEEAVSFRRKLENARIGPVIDHMPYLPNLASPNDDVYELSKRTLVAELERSGQLGIPYLVTHLGSHQGSGVEQGRDRIVKAVNLALSRVDNEVIILLENTAGTKNSMGSTFEEMKHILNRIDQPDRVGVCLDTCHAFAAGYELRDEEGVDITLKELDRVIGLEKLKVVHANDSKGDLGSHIDRHEHIGLGCIGEGGFKALLRRKELQLLPFILETPVDRRRDDIGNLKKIRELAEDRKPIKPRPKLKLT
ncbi:MAG: deoxyribonuclease IV [Candidatus Bathyarchaeia archaeon]